MLIDGRKVANAMQTSLKKRVLACKRPPAICFLQVGDDPASTSYLRMKKKACEKVGMRSIHLHLEESVEEKKLLEEIQKLNCDPFIDGILVQLPLPSHLDPKKAMLTIDYKKDVDGFHPINVGKLLLGDDTGFFPCTPSGIRSLFKYYQIETQGKHVVIVGRSNIVGKPLAAMLMQNNQDANATVTVAHSKTKDLPSITRQADILVAAVGKAHIITKDMVKKGAVVIDVGINRVLDEKGKKIIVGDVAFASIEPIASYITPVPGGVGPMTIAQLLENTFRSYAQREESEQ